MPSSLLTTLILHDDLVGVAKDWDESQHPREPAGTPGGGRFAGGASAGSGGDTALWRTGTSGPGPATRQASHEAAIAANVPGTATMRANVARAAAFQPAGADPEKLIDAARQLARRGIGTPEALGAEAGLRARVAGLAPDKVADIERRARVAARAAGLGRQPAEPPAARAQLGQQGQQPKLVPGVNVIEARRGEIQGAGPAERRQQYFAALRAAGRDPRQLREAAALGARLGVGGVKTLARDVRQAAEEAGRGLPPQHPELKVRTPIRAQDLARSAAQHALGIQPKARAPRAPKQPVMGAQPANKPPVAPAKPPGAPVKPPVVETAGGAARQMSFTGTGFGRSQASLPLHAAGAPAAPGGKTYGTPADAAREQRLMNTEITKNDRVDGGMNETRQLKFADGTKGWFKPQNADPNAPKNEQNNQGQWRPGKVNDWGDVQKEGDRPRMTIKWGMDNQREVAAWKLAQIVGNQDIVPATVVRTVDGRSGSLMEDVTNAVPAWSSRNMWDGADDFARAAVQDFVMGNTDRHGKNWMITNAGKIGLIDHGLTFPEADRIEWMRGFAASATSKGEPAGWGGSAKPALKGSPSDYAKVYVQSKPQILDMLKDQGLLPKAISGVSQRIDWLASMKSPTDWQYGLKKYADRTG